MPGTHSDLSEELHSAILQDDIDRVKQLTKTASASMFAAAGAGNAVNVTNYLLDTGGKVCVCAMETMSSANAWDVHRIMIERSAVDVNAYVPWQGDMLGVAIRRGNAEHVRFMLAHGADPLKARSGGGAYTNLASAVRTGRKDIVELLMPWKWQESGALVAAAQGNHLEVAKLLIAQGFDINEVGFLVPHREPRDNVGTPLHKAIEQENPDMVKLLLDAGADTMIKDGKGKTARELMKERGNTRILAML